MNTIKTISGFNYKNNVKVAKKNMAEGDIILDDKFFDIHRDHNDLSDIAAEIQRILSSGDNITLWVPMIVRKREFELVENIAKEFNCNLIKFVHINKNDFKYNPWLHYGLSVDTKWERDIIKSDFHQRINALYWTSNSVKYNKNI